jgi:DNA replication protein DnaC
MTDCYCKGLLADCPLCGGRGKLDTCLCDGLRVVAKPGSWEAIPCPRCGDDAPVRLELPSGLSTEQEAWTFANVYKDLPALATIAGEVEMWARVERKGWYVFSAPWGRGKSYLMAALVNYFRGQGLEAMYWLQSTMLQELQDALMDRNRRWSFGALFSALATVPLLCIDEFGHVKLTAWREEKLRAILVARSDGIWRPTVFATNAAPEQFGMNMGWLWSRWKMAETKVERFKDIPDLRGRKEEKRVVTNL